MKTIAVYVRVSTPDQSTERQEADIRRYIAARGLGEVQVYSDQYTGTKTSRPGFQAMLKACRQGWHSAVVVAKLDRFSRSLKDLVTTLDELKTCNTGFISVGDDFDMTTPTGRLMLQMIGAFAEFEASLIRDRVNSGIANAKRKGTHCGRPRLIIDPDKVRRLAQTMSRRQVAKTLGIGKGSVDRILKAS